METSPKELPAKTVPALRRYSPPVLIAVIALHLLFGGGAALWVVSKYSANRKLTFNAGPKSPNPSERALEHRVQLQKKMAIGQRPARRAETRPHYRPGEGHLAAHCQKSRQRRARRAP